MIDIYRNHAAGLESPAMRLVAVKPNDKSDLPIATRAIAVGGQGFVQVTTIMGDTGRIFIAPGAPFPIRVTKIWATGTTATNIVGLA